MSREFRRQETQKAFAVENDNGEYKSFGDFDEFKPHKGQNKVHILPMLELEGKYSDAERLDKVFKPYGLIAYRHFVDNNAFWATDIYDSVENPVKTELDNQWRGLVRQYGHRDSVPKERGDNDPYTILKGSQRCIMFVLDHSKDSKDPNKVLVWSAPHGYIVDIIGAAKINDEPFEFWDIDANSEITFTKTGEFTTTRCSSWVVSRPTDKVTLQIPDKVLDTLVPVDTIVKPATHKEARDAVAYALSAASASYERPQALAPKPRENSSVPPVAHRREEPVQESGEEANREEIESGFTDTENQVVRRSRPTAPVAARDDKGYTDDEKEAIEAASTIPRRFRS